MGTIDPGARSFCWLALMPQKQFGARSVFGSKMRAQANQQTSQKTTSTFSSSSWSADDAEERLEADSGRTLTWRKPRASNDLECWMDLPKEIKALQVGSRVCGWPPNVFSLSMPTQKGGMCIYIIYTHNIYIYKNMYICIDLHTHIHTESKVQSSGGSPQVGSRELPPGHS